MGTNDVGLLGDKENNYYVKKMSFSHRNPREINPYSFGINIEYGEKFVKGALEGNYNLSYRWGSGLDIRLFTGRFLYNDFPFVDDRFLFSMHGNQDYLYEHILLGRAETDGLLGAQFVRNDGGFKNAVTIDNAQTWMTAVNIQSSTLSAWPLSVYADFGWSSASAKELVVGAGIAITLIPNMLEIYLPVYTTTGIPYPQYEKNIRFVFNIAAMNPFELLQRLPH